RYQWNQTVAQCHWILGWCALAEGMLDVAEAELRQAEPILHRGQLLFELARLHITAGELALARKDAEGALNRAAEALDLAAPRGIATRTRRRRGARRTARSHRGRPRRRRREGRGLAEGMGSKR